MIIKENEQKFQLFDSKKSKIKYIILLLGGILLLIFYFLSICELFLGKSLYFGENISDILVQFTFFAGGNITFVIFIGLAIYGSIKNISKQKRIVFDKIDKEILFITKHWLLKENITRQIPFSDIAEIVVEQQEDNILTKLSLLYNKNKIAIDSDYDLEGMERLNNLAMKIHALLGVPFQKAIFEDIYIEEEESSEEKSN